MAEKLAAGNVALALLANTIATGAAPGRIDPCLWAYLGGASQSGSDACRCLAGRYRMARDSGIYRRPVCRGVCGRCHGSSDVRAHTVYSVDARPQRPRSDIQRVRRYLRLALCDLGMRETSARCCSVRCGCLHHRRLLVHRVHFVRQPGRHTCPIRKQHVCRYQIGRYSRVCHCPVGWGVRGNVALSVANPVR